MRYIYTLTNPINGLIYYVGNTIDPETRLRCHSSQPACETSRMLNRKKKIPIMTVVQEVKRGNGIRSEMAWIKKLSAGGCVLENKVGNQPRCFAKIQITRDIFRRLKMASVLMGESERNIAMDILNTGLPAFPKSNKTPK